MISLFDILGDNAFIILLIIVGIVGGGILYYLITEKPWLKKEETLSQRKPETNPAHIPLRLAAYERLVLFVERMSLPNVISRVNMPGVDKSMMQMALTQNIREEFEYNMSQQVYVSSAVWNAVSMLKDQNILIINQVAATLPAEASGLDLNKKILEFCANSEIGSLQSKVSEAINIEAKQVMNS
jgi:hypothetical protein